MWFNITYLMCLHQDHISTWFRLLRRSTFSDRSSCRSQNGDAATALCPKNRKIIILFSLQSCFYMQVTVKKMPPEKWFISLFFKAKLLFYGQFLTYCVVDGSWLGCWDTFDVVGTAAIAASESERCGLPVNETWYIFLISTCV